MARSAQTRVPIRPGIFFDDLDELDEVRLAGSGCKQCGEAHLGQIDLCANCGAPIQDVRPLSRDGTLWTYTVVRHRPPGDYKGPDPFVPLPVGLVQLPDGLRILSPLLVAEEELEIGMALQLRVSASFETDDGAEVVAFAFAPVERLA